MIAEQAENQPTHNQYKTMITHYPFNNGIFNELNRFVNQAFIPETTSRPDGARHALEDHAGLESISNDDKGFNIRLELPGYNKDEVRLSVDEGILLIEAETGDEQRSFLGKQERRVRISDEVDVENIKARLENGILYLEIPHRAKAEPKTITVN
jgi:HSP20 family protein